MGMKRGKISIAITYVLLLYFLCFVVPPVSSIIPSTASLVDTKDIAAIGKDTTRERMYLFDLTLWEILKRAKRSDHLMAPLTQGDEDYPQPIASQIVTTENDRDIIPLLVSNYFHTPLVKSSHLVGFSFAPSGLSPPVFA
jgi:hypothetical protein